MSELVVAGKGELEGNAESLDRHDGNGSDSGADREVDESVLLAVNGSNLVNHEQRKDDDGQSIDDEAYISC